MRAIATAKILILVFAFWGFCFGLNPPASASDDLLISAEALQDLRSRGHDLYLVDVRPPDQFQRVHIPGALNMPAYSVRARSFLKSAPLVLIDAGFGRGRLRDACAALRAAGFKARVLAGGLAAWRQMGGGLAGDVWAQRELNRISPRDLYAARNDPGQVVVRLDAVPQAAPPGDMPATIRLSLPEDPAAAAAMVRNSVEQAPVRAVHTVVVADADGGSLPRVEKIMDLTGLQNVFYLAGGWQAYRRFGRNLALSRRSKPERLKSVTVCQNCTQ